MLLGLTEHRGGRGLAEKLPGTIRCEDLVGRSDGRGRSSREQTLSMRKEVGETSAEGE